MHVWSSLPLDIVISNVCPTIWVSLATPLHMYVNYQVQVCYMCMYMYTYILVHVYMHKIHILLIICREKLLLFSIFTIIPWKRFAVTSYYKLPSIHVQNLPKTSAVANQSVKNAKVFFANNKQYMILLYSCTYVVYKTKLLWQITSLDFGIYDQST